MNTDIVQYTAGLSYDWLLSSRSDMLNLPGCHGNCSGHGNCFEGKCACLVQFTGGSCSDPNTSYFLAFGCIYAVLSIVSFIQLCLCVKSEYLHQREKSLKEAAFRLTGQKLLYCLTVFATAIRGIYFFTKLHVSELVSNNLWISYYPFLLSCFSFIVCFWAEAFHLDYNRDKQQLLGKSFFGFFIFNILIYSLLLVQLILTDTSPNADYVDQVNKVVNGCFAGMMILAVIFFLIYGVEVYFKVHGAFNVGDGNVDSWQLSMSRLGLVSQAMFQLSLALFLVSDITKEEWMDRLPVISQNFYEIGFRVVEFSVAVWFPCVLWNCKSPENLWVLNPKKLFKSISLYSDEKTSGDRSAEEKVAVNCEQYTAYGACGGIYKDGVKQDCWICYDPERNDAGPLIQPCHCKGDMASVHHDCLRKWLLECIEDDRDFKCKVCNVKYKLQVGWMWLPKGMKAKHWVQTFFSLIIMVGSPFAAYTISHTFDVTQTYVKVLIIGVTLLVEFSCLRLLVINLGICYRKGRVSTLSILGGNVVPQNTKHHTESDQSNKPPESTCAANQHDSNTQVKTISYSQQNVTSGDMTDIEQRQESSNQRTCSISIEAVIENHRL